MIIIPEIEMVVILVPRTGTGTLRRALAARYPKSFMLYRHMEADGVPTGYDRWKRVGCCRPPVARLWSLYKFLQNFDGDHEPAYIQSVRSSVQRPFEDWLLNNEVPFTSPYDRSGGGKFYPQYNVLHSMPENRKSQWLYLRPDLGTIVFPYAQRHLLAQALDVAEPERHNATSDEPAPVLSPQATAYVERTFAWDLAHSRSHL